MLRHVRALLPAEDIVYLADQAHVPYGDREEDDLVALLAHNVALLEAEGVDAVVMGCNTTCAVAALRGWPNAGVEIFDLIAAAAHDVAASGATRVGVIGTAATVRFGAYGAAIRALAPQVLVQEVAAPRLVPLVEAGLTRGAAARAAVLEAVAPFRLPLDALVLACTHYPLLEAIFTAALGPAVRLIDPARTQAERALRFRNARSGRATKVGRGSTRFLTTGSLETYRESLLEIVGLGPRDSVAARPVVARR